MTMSCPSRKPIACTFVLGGLLALATEGAGAALWSNVYDSGLRIWEPLKRPLFERRETHFEGPVRLTHETALAPMRDAARDVGEWLRNERLRERAL
jgi:hypothetical protein